MPYCLYVRKSRADAEAEARGEGETLTRHINALLDLARRRHLEITQIYREIVSGETIAARPVMQQLLSEVEQGAWDGVLVMEVERLARGDTIDQGIVSQTFKFSGTKIITPIKDYDPNNEFDEEYFEFGLFMSRREYKTINRRLQRGREASVKEGKYVGSRPPYGYQRVKLEGEKGFTLAPDPAEADVVKLIFALYTNGEEQADGSFRRLGISLIVRRLNALKIRPRYSDHWSPATIRGILGNPIYVGQIRWNRRPELKKIVNGQVTRYRPGHSDQCFFAAGKHPPLVNSEIFNRAQELLKDTPPAPVIDRKTIKNPLAGLVICEKCGHAMVRRPYQNNAPASLICPDTACDNISSALDLVEDRVLESLRDWLSTYRLDFEGANETPNKSIYAAKEKALQSLVAEADVLQRQLDHTHDLLEQGIYSADQFLERSKKLSMRIRQNDADRLSLSAEIAADQRREQGRRQIIPKIEHLLKVYDTLPGAQAKNEMLKEVLEKVTYIKNLNRNSGRWHVTKDGFSITIFPKIPPIDTK